MISNGMIELHGSTVTREILKLTRSGYNFIVKMFGAAA
jgi:hypothetical protein